MRVQQPAGNIPTPVAGSSPQEPATDTDTDTASCGVIDLRGRERRLAAGTTVVVIESASGRPINDRFDDEFDEVIRIPAAAAAAELARVLAAVRPAMVLVKDSLDTLDFATIAMCAAAEVRLLILARPSYGLLGSRRLQRFGGLPWLPLGATGIHNGARAKRVGEVALVVATLPFSLLVMAVIAVVVRLSGPILFVQERVGAAGRPFPMLKFRTMVVGAEASSGPVIVDLNDPRITRVGRQLRRFRLDELPQLFNVLRGEMSLVGPRPERPEIMADFQRLLPEYDLRHLIRPGLTGIAQLTAGHAAEAEDKLRCDLLYVNCRSMSLDLALLWRTATDLVRGFPNG